MTTLRLDAINLDAELQPRAKIDRVVLENYVQLLVDGTTFPPVTVFRSADLLLLADGFHRWHAHKVLDIDAIEADVLDGSRRDALLYSLSANATHGAQRKPLDYKRAYEIACRNGLIDPTDSGAVAALLHCTGRWGTELTEQARAVARAARDAEILAGAEAGKNSSEIAREIGVPRTTVNRVLDEGCPNRKTSSSDTPHPEPPLMFEVTPAVLTEIFSPDANNWASALRALRGINAQLSVDALFAGRYYELDHVFGPQLEDAFVWITTLHQRFGNDGDQRRRA